MVEIGKYHNLRVVKELSFGVYLDAGDSEILLPKKYLPAGLKIGDILKVFIYKDSENRPIATTLKPKILLNEFAFLEVKDINKYGAFLDWGIENELLLPYSEQPKDIQKGKRYVVMLYLDRITERLVATARIEKHLIKIISPDMQDSLKEGDKVNLLVHGSTDLGYKTIINQKYSGIIYENDIYQKISIGESLPGYIKTIREDGKIDVTLRKTGLDELKEGKLKIIKNLKENNGFIPLNDESSPEEIKNRLNMSKKSFKRAAGMLYKEGLIDIKKDGIYLRSLAP